MKFIYVRNNFILDKLWIIPLIKIMSKGQLPLFSPFRMGLITKLHDLALGLLKPHCVAKIISEFLIGNLRFLIQTLLN